MDTALSRALDDLPTPMIALERAWRTDGLGYAFRDAVHHVCVALAWVERFAADARAPHDAFDHMDEPSRVLAHEAYLAVVALGVEVQRAAEPGAGEGGGAVPAGLVAAARWAVDDVLDALSPFVCRADDALRATTLDGIPYALTFADLEHAALALRPSV